MLSKNLLFFIFVSLLLVSFVFAETSVLSSKNAVRRISRRTRGLIRKIEHRATGRRYHGRTRALLRRLFKRLHGMVNVVSFGHKHSATIAERRKFTQLLLIIAARLKVIRAKMDQVHEERVAVQPTVNIHGQVNLAEVRKAYLAKMKEAILTLTKRYQQIIKKLKAAARDPNVEQGLKDQIEALKQKVKTIKTKLDAVKKQLKDARAQVKREKAETKAIKLKIKTVKTEAMKTIKSLREMIAKLRKDQKNLADKAELVKTIRRLKDDIHGVRKSVKENLEKHRRELKEKISDMKDHWFKRREELEDAWERKKDSMKAAWAKERTRYEDIIRGLKRKNQVCGKGEIFNIRSKRCVKLNQSRPAPRPVRPVVAKPSSRFGQFSASLKKTKETVAKMNKALKKMAEKERN
jgi:DNA repair exonuclease SbcCD ATPase subunit